jgi:segregation and condensation protein A
VLATPPGAEVPGDAASDAAAQEAAVSGSSAPAAAEDPRPEEGSGGGFSVSLENFAGPFDVLLSLISQRQMDITQVALAAVTDEFIAYVRALRETGLERALDEATEFIVVAATLLDLKAARLLPAGEVEDDEDIAMLEARDLLFARLLQYKAFKDVSGVLAERMEAERSRIPRSPTLPPEFAALLPELVFTTTPERLAQIAEKALTPKEQAPDEVSTDHLHSFRVTIRDEAETLAARLMPGAPLPFTALAADAESPLVIVVRFLALLEMYRDRVVAFAQEAPLAELTVTWIGTDPEWTPERLAHDDYRGTPESAPDAVPSGAAARPGPGPEAPTERQEESPA